MTKLLCIFLVAIAPMQVFAAGENMPMSRSTVISATRFLEESPLDESSPTLRRALMAWEKNNTDVTFNVCPGVLEPMPNDAIKYAGQLFVQFILGGTAYQLANPQEQGNLMSSQLAGLASMLKAYRSIVALEPGTRIPRFDELSRIEADGKTPESLAPLVAANCMAGARPAPNSL